MHRPGVKRLTRRLAWGALLLAVSAAPAAAQTWTGLVANGWYFPTNMLPGGVSLSGAGVVNNVRYDDNDATNARACYARVGTNILSNAWFSCYFADDFPNNGVREAVSVIVQAQSTVQGGTLFIHLSTNRNVTDWKSGVASTAYAARSGALSWNVYETNHVFDVTALLDTVGKINGCEVLITTTGRGGSDRVYFDQIRIEARYGASPVLTTGGGATNVDAESATLQGDVVSGGPAPMVWLYLGTQDPGPTTSGWDRVIAMGTQAIGGFSTNVGGLVANQTYVYRAYGTNAYGSGWSDASTPFRMRSPFVQFDRAADTNDESAGTVRLPVSLSTTSVLDVTVTYAVVGGTASNGADYTAGPGFVVIPAGALSTNIALAIVDDDLNELDESLWVRLTGATNAELGPLTNFTSTVRDNDPVPQVAWAGEPFRAVENQTNAVITVALVGRSDRTVSVDYASSPLGSATPDVDYTNVSGTLTWAPGATGVRTFWVPVVDDALQEGDEVFLVGLSGAVNAVLTGNPTSVVTIVDDDRGGPVINNEPGASGVSTDAAVLNGSLVSTGGSPTRVWIYWGPADGGTNAAAWATNASVGVAGVGPFAASLSALQSHTVYWYRCHASNEYGRVWAASSTNFLTGPPTVTFSVTAADGPESGGTVGLEVRLSQPSVYGLAVGVRYAVTGGTASNGEDYTLAPGTAVIPAGGTTATVPLVLLNDAYSEFDETVTIGLSAPSNAILGAATGLVYTIRDDDPLPTVAFSGGPYSVAENGTSVVVTVALSAASERPVSVEYATVDGTARAGIDYSNRAGTLSWPWRAGGGQTIRIPVIDNTLQEGDKTFQVLLQNPANSSIAGPGITNVAIIENDYVAPVVSNTPGATDVGWTVATLNGRVAAAYPVPAVWIYWGTNDAGAVQTAWGRGESLGSLRGSFSTNLTGLRAGQVYYYRCYASNSVGGVWATPAAVFTTAPPVTAAGANYYVNDGSTAGDLYCLAAGSDGNSGTNRSAPKSTVEAVLTNYNLGPGDVVWIDTGVYGLAGPLRIDAEDWGAAGTSVVFRGVTGPDGSWFDRGGSADDDVLSLQGTGACHVRLESLRLKGGRDALRAVGSSGNPLRGLEVIDCELADGDLSGSGWGGAYLRYVSGAVLRGNRSHGNYSGFYLNGCPGAILERNACYGNQAYGIRATQCEQPVLVGNECREQTDWPGLGLHADGLGSGETIHSNRCFANPGDGIVSEGEGSRVIGNECSGNGGHGLNVAGGGARVIGNRAYGNAGHGLRGSGVRGQSYAGNLSYRNDTSEAGHWALILDADGAEAAVENNTLVGGNALGIVAPLTVTNRNNILWASGAGRVALRIAVPPPPSGMLASDYNTLVTVEGASAGEWDGGLCSDLAAWRTASAGDAHSLDADPLFVDAAGGDFHLKSLAGSYHGGAWQSDAAQSPCIDAGDPWAEFSRETGYNGLRVNQGAYGNTPEASRTYYTGPFYAVSVSTQPVAAGSAALWPPAASYPTNRPVRAEAAVTNAAFAWRRWSGALNDTNAVAVFVVTGSMAIVAEFESRAWAIVATAGPGGNVSPSGTVYVADGSNVTFKILPDASYAVSNVVVDGVGRGATNYWTFDPVLTNHTLHAVFVSTGEVYTSRGTWIPWLVQHGMTNDFEARDVADPDGDGALTWEEFQAGTVPTNAASVFRVLSLRSAASSNRVAWYGTTNTGVMTPFLVYRSTNLTRVGWDLAASNLTRHASGTNEWWDTHLPPGRVPILYWPALTATNAP